MRNTIRRSSGRPVLRSTMLFCNSTAQRTASTTLRNSTRNPSPMRLTTRPLWTAMVGSMRSLRSARRRASVRSSSVLASRLNPTTSAARIAAEFLCLFAHHVLRFPQSSPACGLAGPVAQYPNAMTASKLAAIPSDCLGKRQFSSDAAERRLPRPRFQKSVAGPRMGVTAEAPVSEAGLSPRSRRRAELSE